MLEESWNHPLCCLMAGRNTDCSDGCLGIPGIPKFRQCAHFRGGCSVRSHRFPERRRAATFFCASRFVRAPKSHTETGPVNPALTPGLCLLLREKGRRKERIKRFPPFPLLSINSFPPPLPSPPLCVAHTLISCLSFTWRNHPKHSPFPVNHQS